MANNWRSAACDPYQRAHGACLLPSSCSQVVFQGIQSTPGLQTPGTNRATGPFTPSPGALEQGKPCSHHRHRPGPTKPGHQACCHQPPAAPVRDHRSPSPGPAESQALGGRSGPCGCRGRRNIPPRRDQAFLPIAPKAAAGASLFAQP